LPNAKLQQAQILTEKYGQSQLLQFYKQLAPARQANLLDEILSLDFELIDSLYQKLVNNPIQQINEARLAPLTPRQTCDLQSRRQYQDLGLNLIRTGKVAAVLVAGGQGTRLGHSGPKGTFKLGLPSQKSLFQLQAERLLNLARRTGRMIPWYIMTSAENHWETTKFFQIHSDFGYPSPDLFFFQQEQLPVIDAAGKILLAAPDQISLGPNGNGGCFLALEKSGALADMERRGVDWVFLYGIDNALVRICDPGFIGFTAANQFPSASKVVAKAAPQESVGVLCYRNGRPAIIEYTEMPPELTGQRDRAGNLLYGNANIVTHLFHRDFLAQNAGSNLPYHVAHKKVATIDASGNPVKPEQPNAYKFELFMFDIFPLLDDMAALQVKREEEFAPVKNKAGNDSPETARQLLYQLHRHWLEAAGVAPELLQDRNIEISPCLSLAGEGLEPTKIAEFLRKNRGSEVEIK
jgi:UDP-N-acetylglucosamine/UDP-N-acetylgalactosamine diphosphorylase